MNYGAVRRLELEGTCTVISQFQWNKWMQGARRADKRKVNALVKKLLPDLYDSLSLQYDNPYKYLRTDRHFILVHSCIEYFLRYYNG